MPPVMGAGAFIMASYTQIPYVEIVGMAALPALLYFMSVGFYVRVEVMRSHAQSVELDTEALKEVMKESPEQHVHQVDMEQLSVTDRINAILSQLQGQESIAFTDLFTGGLKRSEVIVTFLALLELVKLRMVRFMQNVRYGSIWVFPAVACLLIRLFLVPACVPAIFSRGALNCGGRLPSRVVVMLQYSSGLNAWMARYLSQIILTATDCTLPALKPRRTFSQSSGEI